MSNDQLRAAIHCARYELRNMPRTPDQRAGLRAKSEGWRAQTAANEAQTTAARRRHLLRSALVFALLTAALWMGSAL